MHNDEDDSGSQDLSVRFLLGELTEQERIDVEERCLTDEDFFAAVLAAEENLIDGYIAGTLDPDVKEKFERHYLAVPRQAARLRLEQALGRVSQHKALAAESQGPSRLFWFRRPAVRLAMAATVLVTIGSAAFLVVVNQRLQNQLARVESELARSQARIKELTTSGRSSEVVPPASLGQVVAIALEPGLLRGESRPARVSLTPDTRLVWLRLSVPAVDGYDGYRVAVSTVEGSELARLDSLRIRKSGTGAEVDVTIPASLFPGSTTGLIKLKGLRNGRASEEVATYVVEILR